MTSKQAAGFFFFHCRGGREGRRKKYYLTQTEGRWGHSSDTIPHLSLSLCPPCLSNPHFNFHHPGCSSHLCNLFSRSSSFSPSSPSPLRLPISTHFLCYLHHPLYRLINNTIICLSLASCVWGCGSEQDSPQSRFNKEMFANIWALHFCYANTATLCVCVSVCVQKRWGEGENKMSTCKQSSASTLPTATAINTRNLTASGWCTHSYTHTLFGGGGV